MVLNKNAQAFFGACDTGEPLLEPPQNAGEYFALNQKQKFLLALEVVVQTGERNARGAADIADRSTLKTILGKDSRRVAQNKLQLCFRIARE